LNSGSSPADLRHAKHPSEHAPLSPRARAQLASAAREARLASAMGVLALAERRITETELAQIERYLDEAPETRPVCESLDFLRRFWCVIVRSTRNPQLEQELRLWSAVMHDLERANGTGLSTNTKLLPKEPYRRLVTMLRRGEGAPTFWRQRLETLLE
jgi:DNA-binding FadR family transcriptional regulator